MIHCMSVRNHEGKFTHLKGLQFAPMSLYEEPFKTPISFSSENEAPSPEFNHILTPSVSSVSLLTGNQFVVNSPEAFLLFFPKIKELTYKQAFLPTEDSHSVVMTKQHKAYTITLGTVIVGLNKPTGSIAQDFSNTVCFFYNGGFNMMDINRIALFVIHHMRSILPGLLPKVKSGSTTAAFKPTMTFPPADLMSRVMLTGSPEPPVKRQKTEELGAEVIQL
jgi:hypothetical protein